MNDTFIELHRRFEEYGTDDTPESQAQRSYTAALLGQEQGIPWDELLCHRLVVILGEPGSGKTRELKARHHHLQEASFFLPLDRLVSEDVGAILDDEENRLFLKWKKGGGETTFFLDAVDESKFRKDNDFFTALDRMKKVIGPALWRSRFVISSRISEWRPQTDLAEVVRRFSVDQTCSINSAANIQRPPTGSNLARPLGNTTKPAITGESMPPFMVVKLLPLTHTQIQLYARAFGVHDPQGFITALDENNAWAFAGRPLDVRHLYTYWNDTGHLSNLTDLTEYMVSHLLAEVANKEKLDPLTPGKARLGAESLAAAVVLCRQLRIRVTDEAALTDDNLLAPATVLPSSWLPSERRAMTDRALFDGASHGAISFHHRYHIEYLAAAWVERLMANNCGLDALEDLLFACVDGERVLRPTLAPVAAWLVTSGEEPWRRRLANWLLDTAPEIHLQHGDPAALPLDYRRQILSNLIKRFSGRSRVMLDWDSAALARLANEGLADDLNRYLLDATIAEDLRSDLLMVVREGKLLDCISAALTLFAEPSTSDNLRIYAASVVRDLGRNEHRLQLAQSWASIPEMSNTLLSCMCEALFPRAITIDGLLDLLRRSHPVESCGYGLPSVIKQLLEQELDAPKAEQMLRGVLELLITPPLSDKPRLSTRHFWMTDLIPVCMKVLLTGANTGNKSYNLLISAIFFLDQVKLHADPNLMTSEKKGVQSLQQAVASHGELRRLLFWERVGMYRREKGKEPKIYEIGGYDTLVPLSKEDITWLLEETRVALPMHDRCLAMEVAANLCWSARSPILSSVWKMFRQSEGNPKLLAVCGKYVWHRLRAPVMGMWFNHFRRKLFEKWWWRRKLINMNQIRQKIHDRWWLWWHLSDLRKGLYPHTLAYFARLAAEETHSRYGGSDWAKAANEWGETIAAAAREGCMVGWRQFSPLLPHEKIKRNSTDRSVAVGLVGLQTQWRDGHLDFSVLSAGEVDQVICYACNELNGLPEWFPELLAARPAESAKTVERALAGEWGFPADLEHVHDVAAKLTWMPNPVEAVTQVFMSRLRTGDPLHPKILEYALTVLLRSGSGTMSELQTLAAIRINQYTPEQVQWLTWMDTWLQLNAITALNHLESFLLTKSDAAADALMVRLCAAMYGQPGERRQVGKPSFLEPSALARLIPLVHRHVRTAEDIDRVGQGVYSPGDRDHAQNFRSRLWEGLKNWPGPKADEVLQALLADPILTGRHDWILHLRDGRKGLRVDDVAWEAKDIRTFTEQCRSEPRSDYQLFRLIVHLVNDIKNHVERSENAANRLQVRSGDLEKDLQGFLNRELTERSLNWFAVTQESTVDLEQRPDLRVERLGLNPIPVEIKLANLSHWSMPKLLECLEDQLVGQYLRAAQVRYGIYVLGNTSPKRRWEMPSTGKRLNFNELVQHIQDRAASLQTELREGVDGIEVIGIDFSDPRER